MKGGVKCSQDSPDLLSGAWKVPSASPYRPAPAVPGGAGGMTPVIWGQPGTVTSQCFSLEKQKAQLLVGGIRAGSAEVYPSFFKRCS